MNESDRGCLPDWMLAECASRVPNINIGNIQPSSIDLRISKEVYRVPARFLPRVGESILNCLERIQHVRHSLNNPLEVGVTYLARLEERLALPPGVYGYANPKSSSGRNNLHTQLVVDGQPRYDSAGQPGFEGSLWSFIRPQSYPILGRPGDSFSQLRLFTADTRVKWDRELELMMAKNHLLFHRQSQSVFEFNDLHISDHDGSIIVTVDLSGQPVGWECLGSSEIFDLSRRDYAPTDFFRPLFAHKGTVTLKSGCFYILRTAERICVPPHLACEMSPMDPRCGDFRVHYAGFIDPGWGYGIDGQGTGRPIVLEVIPYNGDLFLQDQQPIGKIQFEKMCGPPDHHYDQLADAHYQDESPYPTLAKQFDMAKFQM